MRKSYPSELIRRTFSPSTFFAKGFFREGLFRDALRLSARKLSARKSCSKNHAPNHAPTMTTSTPSFYGGLVKVDHPAKNGEERTYLKIVLRQPRNPTPSHWTEPILEGAVSHSSWRRWELPLSRLSGSAQKKRRLFLSIGTLSCSLSLAGPSDMPCVR